MRNLIDLLTEAPADTAEPDYATKKDNDEALPVIYDALVKIGAVDPNVPMDTVIKSATGKGRIPAIRTASVNSEQIRNAIQYIGFREVPELTDQQRATSGQFTIHSFTTPNNIIYTVVLAGRKKGATSELVLNRKDLTPTKLGLAGVFKNRKELATAVKSAIPQHVKDPNIAAALLELVDLAMARGRGQLTPKSLEYVKPVLVMISQDFGEILAPLALASDSDDINFPVGNEKLIDVTVGGSVRYSVKAAGGSGTSMNSLGSLLDDYNQTLTDEGIKKMFNDSIKIWQSTRKEGSVTDRICLASSKNQTPEYLSYVNILGGEFQSWNELKSLLKPLVKDLDYKGFLQTILPASQAGNWGINVGMPDDSNYYLGLTDKKPREGIAGRYSYEHDPVDGAANIIAYSLGKSFEMMVRRGPNRQQYKDIMNNMIQQLNCQLGHVDITSDGKLVITSKPFGNLDFEFDYHAPSHIAGNNRPGFMIVPPNKGSKGKASKIETGFGDGEEDENVKTPTTKVAAPSAVTGKRVDIRPAGVVRTPDKKVGIGRERR